MGNLRLPSDPAFAASVALAWPAIDEKLAERVSIAKPSRVGDFVNFTNCGRRKSIAARDEGHLAEIFAARPFGFGRSV